MYLRLLTYSSYPFSVLNLYLSLHLPHADVHALSFANAHIHTHADCGAASKHGRMTPGAAAGNHYDPGETGRHGGPYGTGHLGDLPNLVVEADGSATIPVLAPRLRVADLAGRSIMIHAAADRYQNHASAGHGHGHGKGGVRMYCGVIE